MRGPRRRVRRFVWPLAGLALVAVIAGVAWPFAGRFTAWRVAISRFLSITESPRERYVSMLRASGLARAALGQAWLEAGEASLTKARAVDMPFRETGVFLNNAAHAVAYRLTLERGRRLEVTLTLDEEAVAQEAASKGKGSALDSDPSRGRGRDGNPGSEQEAVTTAGRLPAEVFIDLFRVDGEGPPERVASRDAQASILEYEVDRDGVYVLRVQPELLRGGRFTLTQRTLATLRFPIDDLDARAVQSFFGAERDRGARTHQGIDIFASRGTAAVAVADGFARPSTNGLGGTVVWLHDPFGGRTFYYAHLDRWAFEAPTRVRAGDVIGYVGTTGNARGGSPHLHFGIYERGPIDPLPFIRPDDEFR
jgi:peptidoglycan LD-endopeptidase LytH